MVLNPKNIYTYIVCVCVICVSGGLILRTGGWCCTFFTPVYREKEGPGNKSIFFFLGTGKKSFLNQGSEYKTLGLRESEIRHKSETWRRVVFREGPGKESHPY